MAITYDLVERGTITATGPSETSPKDVSLTSAFDMDSSFLNFSIEVVRQTTVVQRGTTTVSAGDPDANDGFRDVTITAVSGLTNAHVVATVREDRSGTEKGATARLTSTTNLRIEWAGVLTVVDTFTVEWEVVDHKTIAQGHGATLEIVPAESGPTSSDVVRLSWTGDLLAGETITATYEVFDMAPMSQTTGTGTDALIYANTTRTMRDLKRLLEANLATIPIIEVEGIVGILDTHKVIQGTTPTIEFKIFEDGTQIARDLTQATSVIFRAEAEPSGPILFEKTCTITDAETGRCSVALTATDTATTGRYDAELEVTFSDATILKTLQFTLLIVEAV